MQRLEIAKSPHRTMNKETYFVSIVLPIRNEAEYIQNSLSAVLTQDYDPNHLEVIIADGMSTDKTRKIISNLVNKHSDIPVQVIDNPRGTVPTGLNLALKQAKGDVIIRVDGHCNIKPDYVINCVKYLTNSDIDGVGGPIETVGETSTAETIAVAMSTSFGVGDSAFRTVNNRKMLVDSVAFPAYKRETIRKVGLFDEELVRNQDDEFNYRIRKHGGKILLSPNIQSTYFVRGTPVKLWKQYFQYGYWKVRVLQKHPGQMRLRQFVPPVFTASLLISAVLTFFLPQGKYLFAAISGSYLLANMVASVWTAHQRGWRHLWRLPLVYTILHLSYGLGFLAGLVCFAHRWGDSEGKVPPFEI